MKLLKRKISQLLAFSVFLTSFLTTFFGFLLSQNILKQDTNELINLSCDLIYHDLDSKMESIEQTVKVISSYVMNQLTSVDKSELKNAITSQTDEKLANFLENAALSTENSMSIYVRYNPEISSPTAGIFYVRNDDNTFSLTEPTDISLYKPDDREHVAWWYEPLAAKKPIWIKPYNNKNINNELISYIIPLYKEETLIGVIGMDLDLEEIKSQIESIQIGPSGGVALLDDEYKAITNSHLTNLITPEFTKNLKQYKTQPREFDVNEQMDFMPKIFSHKIDKDNDFFISSRTLINGMNLIFFTPKDRIFRIRNSFFIRSIIIFLICLLIVISLSHKITHTLTKSIIKLTHCAKEISNGNYDVSISFDEKDEMNILAKTFTEVAQKIGKNTKKINELAFSDSLTGVRNRHYLNQMLDNWPESVAYTGVIFCDLNKLKFTNDNYGHDAGDKLLCNFAGILRSLFQTEDIIRYGGDEFVIIIKGIAHDKFNLLLRDFDKANKQDDIPYASVGSLWEKDCTDLQNLINQAENKMYLDKNEFYKKYPEFHR